MVGSCAVSDEVVPVVVAVAIPIGVDRPLARDTIRFQGSSFVNAGLKSEGVDGYIVVMGRGMLGCAAIGFACVLVAILIIFSRGNDSRSRDLAAGLIWLGLAINSGIGRATTLWIQVHFKTQSGNGWQPCLWTDVVGALALMSLAGSSMALAWIHLKSDSAAEYRQHNYGPINGAARPWTPFTTAVQPVPPTPSSHSMQVPNTQAPAPPGAQFCASCGMAVNTQLGAKFCNGCGAAM